jgi:hypothetical protein
MSKFKLIGAVGALAALTVSGCATTAPSSNNPLESLLMGQSRSGPELTRAIAAAEQHPLGSERNPVRAEMPTGQQAYLRRLRCSNGEAPTFNRERNVGVGAFGNIVDLYAVGCGMNQARSIYMDMYHRGHVEQRAVPGFTIVN